MGPPMLTAFLLGGQWGTHSPAVSLSAVSKAAPPPPLHTEPGPGKDLGWEGGKRSCSTHLLLCVILSPRCLPEVGVFGGAV